MDRPHVSEGEARPDASTDLAALRAGVPGHYTLSIDDLLTLILGRAPGRHRDEPDDEDPEDRDEVTAPEDLSVCDPTTGRPRLLSDKCTTCVFRPGNLMHLRPGRLRSMVEDAVSSGLWIVCHTTLAIHPDNPGWRAICRGFHDAHGHRSQMLRIAMRRGHLLEVDLPAPSNP